MAKNPRRSIRLLQQRCRAYWIACNARERAMLTMAIAVVALGLAYALLIDNAVSGRSELKTSLPQLRQQAAVMRGLAQEATALSGKSSTGSVSRVTQQSIEASLASKSLRAQSVAVTADAVRLRLPSVPYASLIGWLDEMHKSSRLAVAEATIVAMEQSGMVDATLMLRQAKGD